MSSEWDPSPALQILLPKCCQCLLPRCRSRRQGLLGPARAFPCLSGSVFSKDLWNSFQTPLVSFSVYDWSLGCSPDLPFSTFNRKPLTEASDFPWVCVVFTPGPCTWQGDPHLSEVWVFLPPLPSLHPWTPSLFSSLISFFCFLVTWVLSCLHPFCTHSRLISLKKHATIFYSVSNMKDSSSVYIGTFRPSFPCSSVTGRSLGALVPSAVVTSKVASG